MMKSDASRETRMVKPFLVAEDLSAISQISLGAAIPILSAAAIPLAMTPTMAMSAQTEGFGSVASKDMSNWLEETFAHWQREHIRFSGALLGYIGNIYLEHLFTDFFDKAKLPLVVIDPAMADKGKLYPNFTDEYVTEMRGLLTKASVITPNLTEAQLLTGHPVSLKASETDIRALMGSFREFLQPNVSIVITGVPSDTGKIMTYWSEKGKIHQLVQKMIAGHYYGSGDVFAAVLSSQLYQEVPFEKAVERSVQLTWQAIQATAASQIEPRFGIQVASILDQVKVKQVFD